MASPALVPRRIAGPGGTHSANPPLDYPTRHRIELAHLSGNPFSIRRWTRISALSKVMSFGAFILALIANGRSTKKKCRGCRFEI